MTEDMSAGRLYAEVVSDTTGFGRDLRRKIDAEIRDLRARIKVELDQRGLITQARNAAKVASAAATVRFKVQLDARGLIGQARTAAAAASAAATVKLRAELDTNAITNAARTAAADASRTGVSVDVGADTKTATAEVAAFKQRAERTGVTIPIRADSGNLKTAGTALLQLSKAPAIAGGVFLLGTAVVQLGGGLVALTSAAAQAVGVLGAIPNLLGVIGQGAASLIIGTAGVGEALKAMGKAEEATTEASKASSAQARATARAVEAASRARARAARSVEDAQRSLEDAQRNADRQAERGARAVADARRALADAREQAVERERAAIERVSDAEWSLARAQESARDAQVSLTRAREEARERIEDLNMALRHSALDEEAAILAVEQARQNLEDANWNPMTSDLQRQQADLAYRQAIAQLEEVRERNDDLQKETDKANKAGVEGSDEVKNAHDQVRDTIHAQQEAAEQLTEAQRSAAKEQRDSARDIADAQRALSDTIRANAEAAEDSARQIEDAHRGIADAQLSLADAERNLAEAQETAAAGGTKAKTAADAAAAALARLSPAGRAFARFLFGLKPRWIELRDAIQQALLPPIQRGITSALPLLDTLQRGLVGSATVVGGLAEDLGALFGEKTFRRDVGTIMASNNRALALFGQTGLNTVDILRHLAVAAGPLVERFARWTVGITSSWREMVRAKRETGELTEFFNRSGSVAAQLGRILGNIGMALFGIGKAAAPVGQQLLDSLEAVTQRWQEWTGSPEGQERMREFFEATKPATEELGRLVGNLAEFIIKLGEGGGGPLVGFLRTLNLILDGLNKLLSIPGAAPILSTLLTIAGVGGALGLVAGTVLKLGGNIRKLFGAAQAATGIMKALGVALRFMLGPVGLVITAIGLLVGAVIYAYRNHEGFRDLVNKVWAAIQTAASWAWTNVLKPTFEALGKAIQTVGGIAKWLWEKAIRPSFEAIWKGLQLYWTYYLKPILTAFWKMLQTGGAIVKWLWQKAIAPALTGIWNAFKVAWEQYIKPNWNALTSAIKWGWERIISPAFEAIKAGVGKLSSAFDTARNAIKTAWDKLKQVVKDPIRGVLELVNTWVIGKFNWVSEKLGGPKIDPIDLSGFRDGGDIPGPRRGARADNVVIRATPDEFMVRRWAADKLRRAMPGALEYINRFGQLPGYAGGGFIRPVSAPWSGVWGRYASGGHHPALDFPTPIGTAVSSVMDGVVNAVRSLTGSYGKHIRITHANGIESIYAHLSDSIVSVGQQVKAGQLIARSGNTGNSTGPHLHLELRRNGTPFNFTDMLVSGKAPSHGKNVIQAIFGTVAGKIKGLVGEPLEWFRKQIGEPVRQLQQRYGNSALARMVTGVPQRLVQVAADKVKGLFGLMQDADNPAPGNSGAVSNEENRNIVRAQAASRGWTGAQWAALDWLVRRESSYNNLAQNPTSTAFGLFQFLDRTWRDFGPKTSDPVLQTKYGLEYIARRYGSPMKAREFHLSHNWYDRGGWLMPGTGLYSNATGHPEAVLTRPQWNTVDDILALISAASRDVRVVGNTPGGRSAALVENLSVTVEDPRDLPVALDEVNHKLRVIDRGGVYARSLG